MLTYLEDVMGKAMPARGLEVAKPVRCQSRDRTERALLPMAPQSLCWESFKDRILQLKSLRCAARSKLASWGSCQKAPVAEEEASL